MGRVLLGQQVPAGDIRKMEKGTAPPVGWLVYTKVRNFTTHMLLFNESKGRELFVRSKEFFTLFKR